MKAKVISKVEAFSPIKIELVIESESELRNMYARLDACTSRFEMATNNYKHINENFCHFNRILGELVDKLE